MKYEHEYTVSYRYRRGDSEKRTFKTEIAARDYYRRVMMSKSALQYCSLAEWWKNDPNTSNVNFKQLELYDADK